MKRIFTLAIIMFVCFSAFSNVRLFTGASAEMRDWPTCRLNECNACDLRFFQERIIFSQNFDDEPTGSTPQGWVVENPSICSLTVDDTEYYGVSGKSAKFMDFTNGFSYVGKAFSP